MLWTETPREKKEERTTSQNLTQAGAKRAISKQVI
jgi:hypothetical protein